MLFSLFWWWGLTSFEPLKKRPSIVACTDMLVLLVLISGMSCVMACRVAHENSSANSCVVVGE